MREGFLGYLLVVEPDEAMRGMDHSFGLRPWRHITCRLLENKSVRCFAVPFFVLFRSPHLLVEVRVWGNLKAAFPEELDTFLMPNLIF